MFLFFGRICSGTWSYGELYAVAACCPPPSRLLLLLLLLAAFAASWASFVYLNAVRVGGGDGGRNARDWDAIPEPEPEPDADADPGVLVIDGNFEPFEFE